MPRVKALEFEAAHIDNDFYTSGQTVVGDYRLKKNDGKWRATKGMLTLGTFDRFDDAKDCAQSDFEQRILSALETT
jgi:hypothetical protein